jgi:alkylation response protein AidB-like acyl-CoA dehydrogenase
VSDQTERHIVSISLDHASSDTAPLWPVRRLDTARAEAIEAMRPVLEAAEVEGEDARYLTAEAVERLAEAGLFKISLPIELGGAEADVLTELETFEAVARISTSACWNLVVANFHGMLPAVLISDEAAREMFLGERFPVVAGQPASIGTGTTVDGGMVVSGRYGWGSGINHAGWVIGGCTMRDTGDGAPDRRAWIAPKEKVRSLDNWHVAGLRATGSSDYVVDDLFIPDGWWFPFGDPGPLTSAAKLTIPEPKRGGPKYRMATRVWPMSGHIGLLLGAAERALELSAVVANRKRRRNATSSVAARPVYRHDLGSNFVLLSAARDNAMRLFGHVADLAALEQPVTKDIVQQIYGLGAHTAKTAVTIAHMAYTYGGGEAVRSDSALQQILRDLLVAQQHLLTSDTMLEHLGEMLVDRVAAPENALDR